MASKLGMLGSIDANTGSPDLGWDTDQFPMDVKNATFIMKVSEKKRSGRSVRYTGFELGVWDFSSLGGIWGCVLWGREYTGFELACGRAWEVFYREGLGEGTEAEEGISRGVERRG